MGTLPGGLLCTSLLVPSSVRSGRQLEIGGWWEYLHFGNWQVLQVRYSLLSQRPVVTHWSQLLNTIVFSFSRLVRPHSSLISVPLLVDSSSLAMLATTLLLKAKYLRILGKRMDKVLKKTHTTQHQPISHTRGNMRTLNVKEKLFVNFLETNYEGKEKPWLIEKEYDTIDHS